MTPGAPSSNPSADGTFPSKTELPDADLYLVSCVKTKQKSRMAARDLYASPWFRKARVCVEATGQTWAILSAKHGLVWPTDSIEPYDETLRNMRSRQRQQWAGRVLKSLKPHLTNVRKVVMLAGVPYRQWLMHEFDSMNIKVLVPMEGLRSGQQLRWLNTCLNSLHSDSVSSSRT